MVRASAGGKENLSVLPAEKALYGDSARIVERGRPERFLQGQPAEGACGGSRGGWAQGHRVFVLSGNDRGGAGVSRRALPSADQRLHSAAAQAGDHRRIRARARGRGAARADSVRRHGAQHSGGERRHPVRAAAEAVHRKSGDFPRLPHGAGAQRAGVSAFVREEHRRAGYGAA